MKYHAKLLQKGIFVPPSQFETCFLSSAHSQQDIKHTVEIATTILSEQEIFERRIVMQEIIEKALGAKPGAFDFMNKNLTR